MEADPRNIRPVSPERVRHVFSVPTRHIPKDRTDKVRGALPEDPHRLWPESDGAAEPDQPKRTTARGLR